MFSKIKAFFKDKQNVLLTFAIIFFACLMFVLCYRAITYNYSQYKYITEKVHNYSVLLAYNGSSMLGYSLLAKLFGGTTFAYRYVGYALYVIGFSLIGVIGFYSIYRFAKNFSKYYQILFIPICLMLLINSGHLLVSFESFIIPLSFGLILLNSFIFYLMSKKKELKAYHIAIYSIINLFIQILFGSLFSLAVLFAGTVVAIVKYAKNKDKRFLLGFILTSISIALYFILLFFCRHETGYVIKTLNVSNIITGFFSNLTSSIVGANADTRKIPGFLFTGLGVVLFLFDIALVIFDTIKNKKFNFTSGIIISLTLFIALETVFNLGTTYTLFYNAFGLCSSLLVLTTLYVVIQDFKFFNFKKINPDLAFFINAAILIVIMIACLLAFGTVGNA